MDPTDTEEFSRTVEIDGFTCGIKDSGNPAPDRPVFVLVHGIGVSYRYFLPLYTELKQHGRVVLVQLPGFGSLPRPPRELTMQDYATILNRLLEHEHISNPVLVGHSMGCQVVTQIAAWFPKLSPALILLGPTVNTKERSMAKQIFRLIQDSFFEPWQVKVAVIMDYFRSSLLWNVRILTHMIEDPHADRLPEVKTSTLVVRGEQDVIVPLYWVEHMTSLLPDATSLEIHHAAHAVMFDHAPEVAAACAKHARSHVPATR